MSGQVVVHHAGDGPGTWAMGSLFDLLQQTLRKHGVDQGHSLRLA